VSVKGRGAGSNPKNRFEPFSFEPLVPDDPQEEAAVQTRLFRDTSHSILARNESPDVPFTYSVNPYRGCEHGCIYCYARPSHEYLGFSAGLDFETKIMVKTDAPRLLDRALSAPRWEPQIVALSGNTDCYQPIEKSLHLTRDCLNVFLRHRNPVGLITKNALVTRDTDILAELASMDLVHVLLSVTTLDPDLARAMEPRTAAPAKRLQVIQELAAAGIPVGVNVAPVIPGLTDEEIPRILESAADHGATFAGYILLRLPGAVEGLFTDWLSRELPGKANKVINRIRDTRNGSMSNNTFGTRMKGNGEIAETIEHLFRITVDRLHLKGRERQLSTKHFIRSAAAQMNLF
jgi:DNA repair photolyase